MARVVQTHNIPYTNTDGKVSYDTLNSVMSTAGSVWEDYEIHSTYSKNFHRYCMGITAPVRQQRRQGGTGATLGRTQVIPSVSFVQLCNPTLIWKADWTAARYNSKPYIPSAQIGGTDWVLLEECIDPGMITVGPDGATPLYRISGTYVFAHTHPNAKLNKNVEFNIPPWVDVNFFNREVPDEMFKPRIITNNTTPPPSDQGEGGGEEQ